MWGLITDRPRARFFAKTVKRRQYKGLYSLYHFADSKWLATPWAVGGLRH